MCSTFTHGKKVIRLVLGLCLFAEPLLARQAPETGGARDATHFPVQQEPAPGRDQERPPYTIGAQANLVVLDVLVTDEDGNVLSGLKRGNFRILDNGKPQVITSFAPTEEPITVVLLLEYSGVAYDYFAYEGAYWSSQFLSHLEAKDWVALVTYHMKPTIQVDFTRNKAEIQDALLGLSFPGFSEANLFDALADTLDKLDRIAGKKVILLITTGMNTFSQSTFDDAIDRIKRSNVTVFCIGMAKTEYLMAEMRSGGTSLSYMQSKNQLRTFADLSGGLAWFPRFEVEIPSVFRNVVGFLRSEYDLGFSPPSEALDGRYHKLKVEIVGRYGEPLRVTDAKGRRRKILVYAREGYLAAPNRRPGMNGDSMP